MKQVIRHTRKTKLFNKQRQCDIVMKFIRKGANNLLQISQLSGIPQAIVSARMSDLINDRKAKYDGFTIYNERKRKRIVIIKQPVQIQENKLF